MSKLYAKLNELVRLTANTNRRNILTQREKRLRLYCSQLGCELCRIEQHLYNCYRLTPEVWEKWGIMETICPNAVFIFTLFKRAPCGSMFVVPADKLCLAHDFTGDIRGFVQMYKTHGVKTVADVQKRTRDELLGLKDVGPYTVAEIDRIMDKYQKKYKEPEKPWQLPLFEASIPALQL